MPIIAPPASGSPYASADISVTLTGNNSLTIQVGDPALGRLFAMDGGEVMFVPGGSPLPTPGGEPSLGEGSLVLKFVAPPTAKVLPPGLPPIVTAIYLDVQEATVETSLGTRVNTLADSVLRAGLKTVGITHLPAAPIADLRRDFLAQAMLGKLGVGVTGGFDLGQAAFVSTADPSRGARFTLRLLDGSTPAVNLAPGLYLRTMPTWGGPAWSGHPLIAAIPTTPTSLDAYVRFEVWNATSHVFQTLPSGVPVDLMDGTTVLLTETTDATGAVHFNVPNLQALANPTPDLLFIARTTGVHHAGVDLPAAWSTRGWRSYDASQSPGYYPRFFGIRLGSAADPLLFRIGLDFHLSLSYEDRSGSPRSSPTVQRITPAAPRIKVDVLAGGSAIVRMDTDSIGEVHGLAFNVEGGRSISFRVPFEMTFEDFSPAIPLAKVMLPEWNTANYETDQKYFPDNDQTSIGDQLKPLVLRITAPQERAVAMYFLKILREVHMFFYSITDGAWTGTYFEPVVPTGPHRFELYTASASGVPYSWPIGNVQMAPEWHWDRATLAHEISHQVMWKQANFSSASIGAGFVTTLLGLAATLYADHMYNHLLTPSHALIEGWADGIEAVFSKPGTPPYVFTNVYDQNGHSMGPYRGPLNLVPVNRGESVEGAFANGLVRIFRKYVVTPAHGAGVVTETVSDGNVVALHPWISLADVKQRFDRMIWQPLSDLASIASRTTTDMLARIEARNPAEWFQLREELNAENMAVEPPTITGVVNPDIGPAMRSISVRIRGTNFVLGMGVQIGGLPATAVAPVSDTELTANTPLLAAGTHDVVVQTTGGSATLPGGYRCVAPPTITGPVTPSSGAPMTAVPIRIHGTEFLVGMQVRIGGAAATSITVMGPTEVRANTPLLAAGSHDVLVQTIGGSATLARGYTCR
jgi:hypothetical protein